MLEIRRGSREEMLNLWWRPPEPLVPRELRIPIGERIRADGTVQSEVPDDDVAAAADAFERAGVDAVAIAFINAYCNPANELAAAEALRRARLRGRDLALAPGLARVPGVRAHLDDRDRRLRARDRRRLPASASAAGSPTSARSATTLLMRSGGGAMTFEEAADRPFETIISGPVAGVEGAAGARPASSRSTR